MATVSKRNAPLSAVAARKKLRQESEGQKAIEEVQSTEAEDAIEEETIIETILEEDSSDFELVTEERKTKSTKVRKKKNSRYYQEPQSRSSVDQTARRNPRRSQKPGFVDEICVSQFEYRLDDNVYELSENEQLFLLRPGESLYVHGVFNLATIYGKAVLHGFILEEPTPQEGDVKKIAIFAPNSSPISPVEAIPYKSSKKKHITIRDIKINIPQDVSYVCMLSNLTTGIEGIESHMRRAGLGFKLFPDRPQRPSGTYNVIYDVTPALAAFRLHDSWRLALDDIHPVFEATSSTAITDKIFLIKGPKNSGKSTFSRLLLNRLLAKSPRVYYLDTDLGQPEFSTQGTISLTLVTKPTIGTPFTNDYYNLENLQTSYIGDNSPTDDPEGYLRGLDRAFHYYDRAFPLVINTQGWVKGLGEFLLDKIKSKTQPDIVYEFPAQEFGANSSYEEAAEEEKIQLSSIIRNDISEKAKVIVLQPRPPSPLEKFSPSDLRTLKTVSYFFYLPQKQRWDFDSPISHRIPYEFSFPTKAWTLSIPKYNIPYEEALYAINATVVAISTVSGSSRRCDTEFPLVPLEEEANTIGLGIISAIDPASKKLYITTPVSLPSNMHIHIIRGTADLPLSLCLDDTNNATNKKADNPYLTISGHAGHTRNHTRKNVMRRAHK